MGNISFGSSYLILSKFKLFPKISKIEKKRKVIEDKYKVVLDFENSPAYKDFLEEEAYFASKDYQAELRKLRADENEDAIKKLDDRKAKIASFKNSKEYKSYETAKNDSSLNEIKSWKVVFEDDFSGNKLDEEKWTTHYFAGENAGDTAYALPTDKAFPTDGNNINIGGGKAQISLKSEQTKGNVWQLPFGFVEKDFKYTTGLMNTAKSFQGKYGKIEMKVKINHSPNAAFICHLGTEKMLPFIDLFRIEDNIKNYTSGSLWGKELKNFQKAQGSFEGIDLSQDYFLFTFIWSEKKMIWKINDEVVNTQTAGIPHENMFLSFNVRGLDDTIATPASMDIAWVKWFQQKDM